ncbi:MAG: bifunctional (p)ppGpp synthetase/guanosine-3',5'-bis(diphosphate) 3'-pyrophosphohydrolase [Armatimonadetes bacterium]|nr:bifunctional (p)ppGpp synthetase/guanosine-3',5'-bis(diphosphate) 3'-pyrophosphohydrolase [Armatimonadota bacterium]MDW8121899.1 bifunctional (p)ppGpp synthetase/guanosine-3',5'-bis(diphosphate) 3'-pyrophosphohydrolase [Armatimonadota bacterium]
MSVVGLELALTDRQMEVLGAVPEDGDRLSILLNLVSSLHPDANLELIRKAYEFAEASHRGQRRLSGEPFIVHPWRVALIVTDLGLDEPSIAAALLHDVVEDTQVNLETIRSEFNDEVARLVAGVTKLKRIQFHTDRQEQVENLRRVLLAMAEDVRVILIKLADRLHNLRTLEALPEEKRRATAWDTLQVYAPIAHRLGIWRIKWELEDLAFKHLDPLAYRELARKVEKTRAERVSLILKVMEDLKNALREAGIDATVQGRPKHLWSIYEKMKRENLDIDRIYDLTALRIITKTVPDCYLALGVVHGLWAPVPGMFTDYIAKPKPNGYQSLHTKVIGPGGEIMEVQIRTIEQHWDAEFGVAAHWRYKQLDASATTRTEQLDRVRRWMTELKELHQDLKDTSEFTRSVLSDLFQDQVFVFTPKGDVVSLPKGSTPVDFAYRIHTSIGHRCQGAKVNGRIVPLDYQLQTGDLVEILTRAQEKPSPEWLRFVRTSQARNRIKRWLREKSYAENLERGKELLSAALAKHSLRLSDVIADGRLKEVAERYRAPSVEDLFASIGFGSVSVASVVNKLVPPKPRPSVTTPKDSLVLLPTTKKGTLLYRLAKCCGPVPNDPIIGFVSRGRGIVVHRTDCPNALKIQEQEPQRVIQTEWGFPLSEPAVAKIRVVAHDRIGLLSDVSNAVSMEGVSIVFNRSVTKDRMAYFDLHIRVPDAHTIDAVVRRIRSLSDVIDVYRAV